MSDGEQYANKHTHGERDCHTTGKTPRTMLPSAPPIGGISAHGLPAYLRSVNKTQDTRPQRNARQPHQAHPTEQLYVEKWQRPRQSASASKKRPGSRPATGAGPALLAPSRPKRQALHVPSRHTSNRQAGRQASRQAGGQAGSRAVGASASKVAVVKMQCDAQRDAAVCRITRRTVPCSRRSTCN